MSLDPVFLLFLGLAHVVQATLVAVAVSSALACPQAGSTRVRARIAAVGFFGAALLPLAAVLPGSLTVAFGPGTTPVLSAALPAVAGNEWPPALSLVARLALAVAVAGALLRLAQTVRAMIRGERLARAARPVSGRPWGLPDAIPFALSGQASGPMVAGLRRETILLPPHLLGLPRDRLRAFLRHELGHVRRGDLGRALAQRLVEDLYWWNPAIARLGRFLAEQREFACDEYSGRGDRRGFARSLVAEARRRVPAESLAVGLGGPPRSGLARRVERLIEPKRALSAAAFAALAVALAGSALLTPRAPGSGHTHIGIAASAGQDGFDPDF